MDFIESESTDELYEEALIAMENFDPNDNVENPVLLMQFI